MSNFLRRVAFVLIVLFAATSAWSQTATSQPPFWSSRPDAAAFEKTENDRLASVQSSLDAMLGVKDARTIENTLMPFDEAIRNLNIAGNFSILMQQVHPDEAFRDRATQMTQKVSVVQTALSLNRDVYKALASLDLSHADAATQHYVQRQLLLFRLAGVDKDDTTQARLKELSDQLTLQLSMFDRNISDSTKTVEITNASELDGLPQDYLDRHKPGPDGKIIITTEYPDILPALKFAKSEDLRRRLSMAMETRAYPKNKDVLMDILKIRHEVASLLGYSSWADLNAADKMILKGANIADFIQKLGDAARPAAQREFAMLLAEKRKANPEAKEIGDYEGSYLSELVRRSQYDFNSQEVRPYLPYQKVKQGILDTAGKLFHVTFQQETNAPAWEPTVETWDMLSDGKIVGRFYMDMHPRAGKFSHAAMQPVLDGIRGKQLPEAVLMCNFPAPTETDAGLMEYGDVVTFFHEFGHLVHWILAGQQQWAGVNPSFLEGDFIEAPSQMLEEWMHSPQVLASFAHHYKTGEPIPADLVARMNRASAFGRGIAISWQLDYTAISYDLYKGDPKTVDPDAICDDNAKRFTPFTPLPDTHMYASFGHLGSYSSAYYTYMWDKVIAEDFFSQFDRTNLLADQTSMKYRRMVLEPGGSVSANDIVKNFLGRPHNMTAFQKWMNEEFETAAPVK